MSTMALANVLLVLICCFQLGHSSPAEENSSRENGNHHDRVPGIEKTSPGTVGREFVFNFPTPFTPSRPPILMISTSSVTNVNVNISVPGIGFYKETTTNRQQHAEIKLPTSTYLLLSSDVQDKTVIVHASAEVSVYGMTMEGHQADAFLAIPVHGLGTEYLVATYGPTCSSIYPTEFTLSAVEDQTDIQISTTTGQNITITMDAYEAYQIHDDTNDLTGSVITSNMPIAVMAGSQPTGVPARDGCDTLLEALPSVDLFGYRFTIGPFMGRDGYVYRILASEKATVEISQYGMIDLDKGEFFEHDVNDDRVTVIKSSNHVLIMQYMKGYRDGKGDTSMVIVPPTEMFAGNVTFPVYDVTGVSGYTYCINIIANCSYIPDMTYDDTIHVDNWARLSQDDMCVSRAEVTPGTHSVGHPDTDATFSVTVYGFKYGYAFSYPVGFNMMPKTTSTSLPTDSLTPSPEDPVSSIPPNDPQNTTLQCGNNTMTAFIPKDIMRGVQAEDLHMAEDWCTGKDYNDTHISISSVFEHCGTVMEVRGEYIVYSNVVLNEVVPVSPGIEFTREHHVEIPVECYMRRNGTSNISFHPETSNIIFQEEGFGQFSFQMQLYPDNLYRIPYPAEAYPIDVHLQDMLYFEAKVSAQDGLVLFIDRCVATSTVNPYSSSRYNFLEDGCSKDSTLELYDSENPTTQRFGLEALGSIDADSPIYIHCFLVLCNATNVTSRCALGCQSQSVNTRVLRSASSGSKPYLMTEGPIRFTDTFEQDQIEGTIDSSNTGDNSNVLRILVASFSVVICCLGVVIVILIKTRDKNVTRTG